MSTKATTDRDTNVGFHPQAPTDAPATRSMFLIIALLLVVGLIIAVFTYKHYSNSADLPPVPEQPAPPLTP